MRDSAMIFDDGERIAGDGVGDRINVRKNGAERGGEDSDAAVALGEISFAEQSAGDAVGYRVHE